MFPHYSLPPLLIIKIAFNILFGGKRSFRKDALACLAGLVLPPRVIGTGNIPSSGPCLVIFNHYHRPGFNAWWMALILAAIFPIDIHFVMTDELTFPGKWHAPLSRRLSRLLLRRIASMYSFSSMPPMPPRPGDVHARAAAVLRLLDHARQHPRAVIGLAPEGGDDPGGNLTWPAPGLGRLVRILAGLGYTILPVGMYEAGGVFCVDIGSPFRLDPPGGLSRRVEDRHTATLLMSALAERLPLPLQGGFGTGKKGENS
jgi:hypothetical protein